MENQEAYQKSRQYKRIESYYNVTSRNNIYSVIMVDIIMVVLPLLAIIYLLDLCKINRGNTDSIYYIYGVMSLFFSTILVNFLSHCVSIKAHRLEISWAEDEMGELNGIEENKNEHSDFWSRSISVLNYISYAIFLISIIAFFILIYI